MLKSAAEHLSELLTNLSEDRVIYIDNIPTKDNLIACYNYAGNAPDAFFGGDKIRNCNVQIKVINTAIDKANDLCEQIIQMLDNINFIKNNMQFNVKQLSEPLCLGFDKQNRVQYTINYLIQISKI